MSTDEFFGKYDQKPIDFDGYYGYQCMDLYRQYVKECLNFPQSPPVEGAKDVWNTYLTDYFDRILNTVEAIPIKGDIIIWSSGVGPYGHIAVCKDGSQLEFTSFDQNWPVGTLCHFQKHNYTNVLGWLRVKQQPQTPPSSDIVAELTKKVEDLTSQVDALKIEQARLKSELEKMISLVNTVREILYGKGWPWTKVSKLKELLP